MSGSDTNTLSAVASATPTLEPQTKTAACLKCGAKSMSSAAFCPQCGTAICTPPGIPSMEPGTAPIPSAADETPYFQRVFAKFEANGGDYVAKGTTNWVSFVFSTFWDAWKGMWVKAIWLTVVFGVCYMVLAQLGQPVFVAAVAVSGYALTLGNYDYYFLRRRRTQWYDRPSRHVSAWLVNLRTLVKVDNNAAVAWANKHSRAVGFAAVFLLNFAFVSGGDVLRARAIERAETAKFDARVQDIIEHGTLEDAQALVAEEKAERDALIAERDRLLRKAGGH